MRKYLYFRDVTDEDADDDISSSIAIPIDAVAGVVPVAITTLELYVRKDGVVADDKVTLTCTRGKLQEAMQDLVATINGYMHSKAPLTVAGDAATTTVGSTSIEGNNATKSAIYFSPHVTAVAIAGAQY